MSPFLTGEGGGIVATREISGKSALLAARLFNIVSIVCTVFAPLWMIWMAASMFMYAAIAHHPNPRTVHYNRWAAYRFYGISGTMVVIGQPLYSIFDNWRGLVLDWVIVVLVVVPAGIFEIIRAGRENWPDMTVEVEE